MYFLVGIILGAVFVWPIQTAIEQPDTEEIKAQCANDGGVSSWSTPSLGSEGVVVCKDGQVKYR